MILRTCQNYGLCLMLMKAILDFLTRVINCTFTLQAMPGVNFTGNIIFIDPVIDPVTRVAKVRVEVNNEVGKLKPEMFATGIVYSNLSGYYNDIEFPFGSIVDRQTVNCLC